MVQQNQAINQVNILKINRTWYRQIGSFWFRTAWKRCILNCKRNDIHVRDWAEQTDTGRAFQKLCPATVNACSPSTEYEYPEQRQRDFTHACPQFQALIGNSWLRYVTCGYTMLLVIIPCYLWLYHVTLHYHHLENKEMINKTNKQKIFTKQRTTKQKIKMRLPLTATRSATPQLHRTLPLELYNSKPIIVHTYMVSQIQ